MIINIIKSIFRAIARAFSGEKNPDSRETSDGTQLPDKDIDDIYPDKPQGTRPDYSNADKERYPAAVKFEKDPTTGGEKIKPQFVILHHTVSRDLDKTVEYFKDKNVSVHYVVGKDGRVVQMSDNSRKCWHAGESKWGNFTGLNSHSVGIEVVNMGPLKKKGGKFFDYYDKEYTGPVHFRKGLGYEYWEAITPQAEAAVIDLCTYLHDVLKIPVENFLGHYEIAPDRKNDPFGLFSSGEMKAFRQTLKNVF